MENPFKKEHTHAGVYAAIAGSLVISLVSTYYMVMKPQIDQVGGRENYKLYEQMIKSPKYSENIRQSLESQKQMLEGGEATTPDSGATGTATIDDIKALFKDENIVLGDADSKVLFVEISDPSCPYCHAAAGLNPELSKQMGPQFVLKADGGSYESPVEEMRKLVDEGKAGMVFLYSNGHGNGELAAQALYCANEKGKFWQVHDLLMTMDGYTLINDVIKNDKANAGKLADFTAKAIDKSFLKTCLESGKYASKLNEDMQTASGLGSRGTPGFFVNATSYSGAVSFANMRSTVEAAMN